VVEDRFTAVAVLGPPGSGCGEIGSLLGSSGFFRASCERVPHFDSAGLTSISVRTYSIEDWSDMSLAQVGARWDEPPRREEVMECGAVASDLRLLLSDARDCAGPVPLVIDDVRLVPLWATQQDAFRDTVLPVVVLRNPLAVARTMADRHSLTVGESLALWETYMAAVCDLCVDHSVVMVGGDTVLSSRSDAQTFVKVISSRLSPTASKMVSDDLLPLEMGLPGYFRAASLDEFGDVATRHQSDLWEQLSAAGEGFVRFPPLELRFRRPSALASEGVAQHAGRRSLADEVRRLEHRLGQVSSELQISVLAHEDSSNQLTAQVAELERVQGVASELLQRVRTMARVQGELQRQVTELEDEARHLRVEVTQVGALQEALAELRSSETWRIGRVVGFPLRWTFSLGRRLARRLHGG
jgi:hypothetical protein